MCGASGINVAKQGKGERQRWSRKKRWTTPAERIDPFYHFSTLPDIAKTSYYRAARRCMPEPHGHRTITSF